MIMTGSKIALIKDVPGLKKGTVFTVTHVDSDGTITFTNHQGTGIVSSNEFRTLFEEQLQPAPRRVWSAWEADYNDFGEYRTRNNGHVTQVELWNGIRGEASCSPEDEFDKQIGIDVAMKRAIRRFKVKFDLAFIDKYGDDFVTL